MGLAASRFRGLLTLSVGLSLVAGGAAQAARPPRPARPAPVRLGPNLAPNPSFEQSMLEPATANGLPATPVGWTFEGATVLFDYNAKGGHTGPRQVEISGTLGGGTQICDHSSGSETCVPNPAYPVTHAFEAAAVPTYSIRPVWRTASPLPVTAGKTYRFSVWGFLPTLSPTSGVAGQGAQTRIRWTDAMGRGLSVVDGGTLVKGPRRLLTYRQISADLTAPAGATGAVLMLGHTDYTHAGVQVAFDDVSFNQIL